MSNSVYGCLTQSCFFSKGPPRVWTYNKTKLKRLKKNEFDLYARLLEKNEQSFASSDFFVRPVRHVLCRLTHRWIADRQLFESVDLQKKKWNTSENKKYFKRTECNTGLSIHLWCYDYDPIRWSRTGEKNTHDKGEYPHSWVWAWKVVWNDFFLFLKKITAFFYRSKSSTNTKWYV